MAGLFVLGLAAGLYATRRAEGPAVVARPAERPATASKRHVPENLATTRHPADGEPEIPSSAAPPASTAYAAGDDLLKRGWYEHALAWYESFAADRAGKSSEALQLRMALCLEGLGYRDRALAAYGDVAVRNPKGPLALAARLARARLWFHLRNVEETKRSVCDLLLSPPCLGPRIDAVLAESSQLLGLTLATEALGREAPGPQHEAALAPGHPVWRPESLLDWAEPSADETGAGPYGLRNGFKCRRAGPDVHECGFAAAAPRGVVFDLIRRMAKSAGYQCAWSDQAAERARGRRLEFATGELPCPVLLTCLTEPLRIGWDVREKTWHLRTYDELSAAEVDAWRARVAKSILLAGAGAGPHRPESATACLGLGRLAFADGQPDAAGAWFEQVVAKFPKAPQVVEAHFNQGVVQRSQGQFAAARTSFFHVIDNSPAGALAPLAYLFVGRMHLDECDHEGAIAPLRRVVAAAAGSDVRPAAAIDLATALLLARNWRAAGSVLHEHRAILDQPDYRPTAAFLAAYAGYRAQADRKLAQREAAGLIAALCGIKSASLLAPCGILVVGRAYADLGLTAQMTEIFQSALDNGVAVPIAQEILRELAESAYANGSYDEAAKHLAEVYRNSGTPRQRQYGLKLAEIALADDRNADCLSLCNQLLAAAEKPELPAILKLMGRAYEQTGDYRRAAQCFAGLPPTP